MCNYKIKLNFLLQKYKKSYKTDKEQNYRVDGHRLAKNYDRQIQGQTNFRTTIVMVKKNLKQRYADAKFTVGDSNGAQFSKVVPCFKKIINFITFCSIHHRDILVALVIHLLS